MNKSHRTESIPLNIMEKRAWREFYMAYTFLCISYLRSKRKILFVANNTVNNAEYISIHYTLRLDELAKMAEFVSINKLLFATKCDSTLSSFH